MQVERLQTFKSAKNWKIYAPQLVEFLKFPSQIPASQLLKEQEGEMVSELVLRNNEVEPLVET